jgi:hypothetical protein
MPFRIVLSKAQFAVAAAALSLVLLSVLQPAAARAAASNRGIDVVAVRSMPGDRISVVAQLRPATELPLDPSSVTVTSGASDLPPQTQPLLSGHTAVAVVVDASAAGAPALQGGGQAGLAALLLQLPSGASSAVIADRHPPAVVTQPSVGVSDDLQAISALKSGGPSQTSAALTLALGTMPPGADIQPVIVLYTSSLDAGGETAAALSERLLRAHAVLAVVDTSAVPTYWANVAAATGGLSAAGRPDQAIGAFDQVADALRARSVVSFPRPPAGNGQATVRVGAGSRQLLTTFRLPSTSLATAVPVSSSDPVSKPASSVLPNNGTTALLAGSAAAVAVLVILGLILLRRRGRIRQRSVVRAGTDLQPVPVPAGVLDEAGPRSAPAGVRVFDVTRPGGPREITDSLFEPRIERDARAEQATASASPSVDAVRPDPSDTSLAARLARRRDVGDRSS